MEKPGVLSGRFLLWLVFITVLLVVTLNGLLYVGIDMMAIKAAESQAIGENLPFQTGLDNYLFLKPWFLKVFVPGTMAVALLFALVYFIVLGFVLRADLKSAKLQTGPEAGKDKKGVPSPDIIEEKANRRLFLHLLSVLQSEGRLLDFLSEKLDDYDDAQVGAAVRHIHEQCSKTLDKYLKLEPVMDKAEGETVTIESGFDTSAIKLTGQVVGNPPFKGIVRHKGWKASKTEIPKLSQQENPGILAMAEVEIQP